MSSERYFVFDTNVLISAFLFKKSNPREALDLAMTLGIVVLSEETLDEIWTVLMRPRFDHYLSIEDRILLLQGFEDIAEKHLVTSNGQWCRDAKDDKFLNLAISVNAECIITGDEDLLVLKDKFPISIIKVVEFLAKYN